ncbi:MAG: hypothetical protein IKP10_02650 [Clostridia bacterium]|nr:hypothetical protein [Clostridia bacterium]
MANRKRLGALLICAALLLALIVSSAFIAHEAGHDCSGEDCLICRMIAVNANLPHTIGLAVIILAALIVFARGGSFRHGQRVSVLPASGTLVSWKIRLND